MKHYAESNSHHYLSTMCVGGQVEPARADLLKEQGKPMTCLKHGDVLAKERAKLYTVVPMNKSNYMLVTDHELLKQLNPKRTT